MILAAGRGSRLDGVAAPFWKPMTVVDGEPLIVSIVRGVRPERRGPAAGPITIVVSPENAQPICQLLIVNDLIAGIELVIQPESSGPGEALLRARPFIRDDHFMMIAADNVIPDVDLSHMMNMGDEFVIGIKHLADPNEAARYTLIGEEGTIVEGTIAHMMWSDGAYRAWLGPLIAPTVELLDAIESQSPHNELKIGPALGKMGLTPRLAVVDCYDVGTPGWDSQRKKTT